MVSMKDIANACDCSIATVSKALNGHTDIGKETADRIRRKADELGYLPNAAARALKTNRSYNLGVLLEDEAHSGLTHEYFSHVLQGFKQAAEDEGFDITLLRTNNRKMTYREYCKYRNLDGVLVACVDFEAEEVKDLIEDVSIPTISIDYVFNGCSSVESNNVRGMQELTEYAIKQGHKKIAYIHGEGVKKVTKERIASFYSALEKHGIKIPDAYVQASSYLNSERAELLTQKLLSLPNPPTCILYPDDYSAFGGVNAVRAMNLSVPEDVSVAGYDGTDLAMMLSPKLTTIAQDAEGMGSKAASELITSIEHPKSAYIKHIVIDGRLIKGGTIRRLV